jgi:purine-binding chemotaxis protein CheW
MKNLFQKDKKAIAVVDDLVQLVTFRVGAEDYGLDINAITEVVRPLRITPLPRMPLFIEGVINLRGTIIPVVDLRKRFVLASARGDSRKIRMLITKGAVPDAGKGGKELLGLVVDGVDEVIHVPKKDIAPPPEAATGKQAGFIGGMGKVGDRLIIILDIMKILSTQERSDLAEAQHAES